MRSYQGRTSLSVGGAGAGRDRLLGFEKAFDAAHADQLQRDFLGGEIIIEAGLPDAEHVGDVLCGGAVIAALGEHLRRPLP